MNKETPDSVPSTAVTLFKGIGFIILGNLYDNVRMPKRLTSYILFVLAILTSLVMTHFSFKFNIVCTHSSGSRKARRRLGSPGRTVELIDHSVGQYQAVREWSLNGLSNYSFQLVPSSNQWTYSVSLGL